MCKLSLILNYKEITKNVNALQLCKCWNMAELWSVLCSYLQKGTATGHITCQDSVGQSMMLGSYLTGLCFSTTSCNPEWLTKG